jgi:outer membrane lipoprotein-sorting protein
MLPVAADGRSRPEIATLPADGLPTLDELFTFMRDAELRFQTLRMRIEERTGTTEGDTAVASDVLLRHPGFARILTSDPGGGPAGRYEVWISDGAMVRTYVAERHLGTQRPVRGRVRGVADAEDLPGRSRIYVPLTPLPSESLPDLFIHPGGYCQNVLGTGDTRITGTALWRARETVLVECRHPRVVETVADRPDFTIRLAVDRSDGVILRLEEWLSGRRTRLAEALVYEPDAPLPPSAFDFTFPSDAAILY